MSGDDILLMVAVFAAVASSLVAWRFVRSRAGAPGPSSLLIGNGLVLFFLCSLSFLGLECYHRFFRDVTDGDSRTKVSRRWFERHWVRNGMNLRDDIEYAFSIEPGYRRVTILGDSFTAGHGVTDVGDRFVNRIRRERPGWEVHGIAVLGASTVTQQSALAKLVDAGYELDSVVLAYVFNDLEPFVPELEPIYRKMKRPPPALLAPLVEHSFAINALFFQWRALQLSSGVGEGDYFSIIENAYLGQPWEHEKRLLRDLVGSVRGRGGRFLAVTFPQLIHLGRGEAEEHAMHARLAEFWRELDVPHLDLLPLFDEHRGPQLIVSRYDDHPSAFAHRLAADAMVEFVESNIDLPLQGQAPTHTLPP